MDARKIGDILFHTFPLSFLPLLCRSRFIRFLAAMSMLGKKTKCVYVLKFNVFDNKEVVRYFLTIMFSIVKSRFQQNMSLVL